jgi:pimeloyl-ACP methyl ester carboxylesterase
VVSELAVEHPPAALVLRSPFTELADTAAVHYPFLPVRKLLKDRFPVAEHVRRIQVPTVVIFGTADSVVPADQSRAVADAAAGPVTVVEIRDADHNDPVLLTGSRVVGSVVGLVS